MYRQFLNLYKKIIYFIKQTFSLVLFDKTTLVVNIIIDDNRISSVEFTDFEIELYKTNFTKEEDRKTQFNNEIPNYISLLSLIFVAMIFFGQNIDIFEKGYLFNIWVSLLIISFSLLFIGIVLLFKAFYNYQYSRLPTSDEVNKYAEEFKLYYSNENEKMELVNKELTKYMTEVYKLSSAANNNVNNKRTDFKIYGYNNILYSLIFLFLSSFLFSYKYFQNDNKSQTVEIKNINEIVKQLNEQELSNKSQLNKELDIIKSQIKSLEIQNKVINKKYDMINNRVFKKVNIGMENNSSTQNQDNRVRVNSNSMRASSTNSNNNVNANINPSRTRPVPPQLRWIKEGSEGNKR